ncbi:MAG: adenylosuccinate synthase [Candidatus Cloacimonetes bacterium]|nr:adenylosuccinate synthase [Candidatus Cloacimonadota bacterium]
MSATAVLGCAWGDEAKAKIVDVLAREHDMVIRFQGGNNAGHTIWLKGQKYVFHLVPAGILYPDKICALASGVVVDPFFLIEEIANLESMGIRFSNRFFIDPRVNLVLPLHRELDAKSEAVTGREAVGTTRKGIGPCYSDLVARVGIRLEDAFHENYLLRRLNDLYSHHNLEFTGQNELVRDLLAVAKKLKPFVKQVPYLIHSSSQKKILFEGAQGSLLDIYYGTYPFVTSSHTSAGGIFTGSGISPFLVDHIWGVFKSYYTRVGNGPFPTELRDRVGDRIRERGREYGSTTGRPRRCGWFDAVAARYTCMINGINEIALTLLDVLSGFPRIMICTKYKINGKLTEEFPSHVNDLQAAEAIYEELAGWQEEISGITDYQDLPGAARNYINFLEETLQIKIGIISVGPDRVQTIFRTGFK